MQALRDQLRETTDLVRRVLAQTRARVLEGDTHYPDKVLSLFEPETEAIRKGKAAKPTEFGKVVKIQEAEAGLITDYTVCPTRVPDQALWIPALTTHQELFDRPPHVAVADSGFGRPPTSVRPGSSAWTRSRCREHAAAPPRRRSRRRARAGFAVPCAGALAARAGSVSSSAAMGCGAAGIAGRAAWSAGLDSG